MVSVEVCGGLEAVEIELLLKHNYNIYNITAQVGERFNVLVLSGFNENARTRVNSLKKTDMLIINGDDKTLRKLVTKNVAQIVTYGLNQKNCVTASSVDVGEYTTLQCCVQRQLPIFAQACELQTQELVDEQEFTIKATTKTSVDVMLACVSCALVCNKSIETITNTLF